MDSIFFIVSSQSALFILSPHFLKLFLRIYTHTFPSQIPLGISCLTTAIASHTSSPKITSTHLINPTSSLTLPLFHYLSSYPITAIISLTIPIMRFLLTLCHTSTHPSIHSSVSCDCSGIFSNRLQHWQHFLRVCPQTLTNCTPGGESQYR